VTVLGAPDRRSGKSAANAVVAPDKSNPKTAQVAVHSFIGRGPRLRIHNVTLLAKFQFRANDFPFVRRSTPSEAPDADSAIKRAIEQYGITDREQQKRLAAYRVG
jgi:hypothetical protein